MTYADLASFIEKDMRMSHVYQPVMLGLMLRSENGIVTESEVASEFALVLDDVRDYDVRRYPGDILIEREVIERLPDGTS